MLPIQKLRTLAFRLAAEQTELPFSYQSLPFPAGWSAIIDDLSAAVKKHRPSQYGPRVKALKQLALALFPQLITVEDYPRANANWLCSTARIEAEHLQLIFSTWISAGYNSLGLQLPQDLSKALYDEPLIWSEETHDLAGVAANKWDTASLTFNRSFDLIPELLADALSRRGVVFDYHSQPLEFRRAPSAGNGVELISWAPLKFKDCAYSIFFKFSLQTVPFQPFPVLYCDMGIRRWVSAPNARLRGGDHSVYLLTRLAGVEAASHTQRFQMASVRRKNLKNGSVQGDEQASWQTVWDDLLPELFTAIYPPHRLPTAEDITREPLTYINRKDLSAAIVVNNMMPAYQHSVRHGLTPVNRSHLTAQLAEKLKPLGFIHVVAPHRVAGKAVSSTRNLFFPPPKQTKKEVKDQAAEVRRAVAKATGGNVRFELWYQSSTVLAALADAVSQTFSVKNLGNEFRRKKHWEWKTPELSVELQVYPLGDLANELEGVKKDERRAFWRRAEEVVNRVGSETSGLSSLGTEPIPAFIELADASSFKSGDPKESLRAGFAEAGRVTQFITPLEEDLNHRAKMSLLDLLRQLGVQSGLPLPSKKVFPGKVSYVAVWLYKPYENAKRYLPMMLWMAADGSEVRATASGLNEFLPYPQFLRRLTERGATKYITHTERGRVPILIRQWLDEIRDDSDLLLLAHSQNTRGAWNWLQDGRIAKDHLAFVNGEQLTPVSEWAGVRVVRVRDSGSSETPESFAQRDRAEGESHEDTISFTQGLFQSGDRVFYSMTGKPKQRIKLSRKASKSRNPDLQAWNARIVELTVACMQQGDESWHWAMLAHRLREAAVHYDDPMTLPLPLHLLITAKQYAQIGANAASQETTRSVGVSATRAVRA
jgi:hypothetical protein